eukprot:3034192-Rhodomonas_salina.1
MEQWNPPPPEVLVSRFFTRYSSPDQNPLKQVLTPEMVVTIRNSLPKKNPVQVGFSVNKNKSVTIRFDDLHNISSTKELTAMMLTDCFEFPDKKQQEEYVIFIQEEGKEFSKAIFTVVQNQRAVDLILGEQPFLLDNYPVSARVYTSQGVKQGKVLKIDSGSNVLVGEGDDHPGIAASNSFLADHALSDVLRLVPLQCVLGR